MSRFFEWRGDDGSLRREERFTAAEKSAMFWQAIESGKRRMETSGSVDTRQIEKELDAVCSLPEDS